MQRFQINIFFIPDHEIEPASQFINLALSLARTRYWLDKKLMLFMFSWLKVFTIKLKIHKTQISFITRGWDMEEWKRKNIEADFSLNYSRKQKSSEREL